MSDKATRTKLAALFMGAIATLPVYTLGERRKLKPRATRGGGDAARKLKRRRAMARASRKANRHTQRRHP